MALLRADTYAEFQERYLTAFGAPNLRRLLRTSTTYMTLDDHEIEDNWTQDRINDPGSHQLFNLAISAYMTYEWSHGPCTWGRFLYYTFESAGYPFFVLDTRTQRFKNNVNDSTDKGLRDNHLPGYPSIDPAYPGQLQRLLDWLSEQQKTRGNGPKFVVTSSVFVPIKKATTFSLRSSTAPQSTMMAASRSSSQVFDERMHNVTDRGGAARSWSAARGETVSPEMTPAERAQ